MTTPFADLPFVIATLGKATSLWNVTPSGDYEADNKTGASYADAAIAFMIEANDPAFLPLVVRSIMRSGRWSGVEVGFFNRLGESVIEHR